MIENTWSIDWLSTTFKNTITDTELRDAVSFGFKPRQWTETTPRFGYNVALTHPLGHSIMSNFNRPEMGVHLSLSGRALRSIAEGGHSALSMLRWQAKEGGRVSRLDLAIDVYNQDIDLIALAEGPRDPDAPGSARKWSTIAGNDGGRTIYVGSRQSDKFLRIYDKAAETGQKERAWVRFELELKSDAARVAAAAILDMGEGSIAAYIKGVMRALFNPIDPLYQAIMAAPAVVISGVKDTDDRTLEWLIQSVAKTLAKTIERRSDVDVWQLFGEAVVSHLKPPENGPESDPEAIPT